MSAAAGGVAGGAARRLANGFEQTFYVLLLVAALLPRLADVDRPLDRQFDGFQGGFFLLGAANAERFAEAGLGVVGDYPVVDVALDLDSPETWYVYANHPPLVPRLVRESLARFAPDDWSERRDDPGVVRALRLPFLALHVLGAALLVAALARAGAGRAAWIAGVLYAWTPVAVVYAGLANYENASVPWVLLAAVGAASWWRGGRRVDLALVAVGFALGGAATYAPALFLPFLALAAWARGRLRDGLDVAVAGALGLALPLALHAHAAARLHGALGRDVEPLAARARALVAPLLDGSLPFPRWLAVQAELARDRIGPELLAAAALGAVAAVLALLARRREGRGDPDEPDGDADAAALALALAAGGALVQLAYYRHTGDPQDPFLLNLAPGLAALGGVGIARLAGLLRSGASAAVAAALLAGACAALGADRADGLRARWRDPGPADVPPGTRGDPAPLPLTAARDLDALVPAGATVWVPAALGLQPPAVAWYARRPLQPVTPATWQQAELLLQAHGLGGAPLWLAAPRAAPPAAEAEATALLALLEAARGTAPLPPDAETERWRAWRLR